MSFSGLFVLKNYETWTMIQETVCSHLLHSINSQFFFHQNTIYIQLFFFLIKKKPHSTKTFPNSQYFYNSNNERFFPGLIYDMSTFTYVFHRNVSASFWHDQHLQLKRENNIIVLELLLLRKLCRFGICIKQPELFKSCVICFTV